MGFGSAVLDTERLCVLDAGRLCVFDAGAKAQVDAADIRVLHPARAGAGYSVQLFPDYEFLAAFVYDARGEPRFLTAERQGFGGASADLVLEQLSGFCPTCERPAAPERFDVGVIGRTFSQGQLRRITLDAAFTAGVGGSWSADEDVQPLGGPGTTQGCEP